MAVLEKVKWSVKRVS